MRYLIVILLTAISCGFKAQYKSVEQGCIYTNYDGNTVTDSTGIVGGELRSFNSSEKSEILLLYHNQNTADKTMLRITLLKEEIHCYKISADKKTEISLTSSQHRQVIKSLNAKLVDGRFIQQCPRSNLDGASYSIFIKQLGDNKAVYFSPYDNPLLLDSKYKLCLGETFKIIEVTCDVFERSL